MASSLGSLVVRLGLDAGDYTAALGKAEADAQKAASKVERSFSQASTAARSAADSTNYFARAMGALVGALGVRELARLSDEYQNASARLQIFTNSSEELARLQGSLFGLAQNSRQSLAATVDLYYQLANATQDVGVSSKQLLQITEGVNKGLIISGSTGDSAKGVIIQLSQALAAGKLRGQEFNTVNEQGNRIMRAVAEGLGLTVGQLRELANAGEFTTEVFVRGFTRGLPNLLKDFDKIPVTITGALTIAQNQLQQFLGTTLQSAGQSNVFAQSILLVAKNLDVLVAATAGYLTFKVGSVIAATTTGWYKEAAAIAASTVATRAKAGVEAAALAAELSRLRATEATIIAARAQTASELAAANAIAVKTAASRAAAAAAIADLALLGRAQAATTAGIVAAEAAQAAAVAGKVGIVSRVLGFLGGPLGALVTVLSLGATAWSLWSTSAEKATSEAAAATEASTEDILAALEKVNNKLRERISLQTNPPSANQGDSEAVARLKSLEGQVNSLRYAQSLLKDSNPFIEEQLSATLKQRDAVASLVNENVSLRKEEDRLARGKLFKKTMEEYATDTEKLETALKKARAELGDLFTPELERRIRDRFAKKPAAGSDDSRKIIDGQIKALEASIQHERDVLNARESFLRDNYQDGYLTVKQYYDQLIDARDKYLLSQVESYDQEIIALQNYKNKIARTNTERADAENRIQETNAKRANAIRDAEFSEQSLNRDRVRALEQFRDQLDEVNAKVLELSGNLAQASRIRFDAQFRTLERVSGAGGDERTLGQIQLLREQANVQALLAEKTKEYGLVLGALDVEQERLNISVATGMVTELSGLYETSKLTASKLEQLRRIANEYERIAELSKDPSDLLKAKQMKVAIEQLEGSLDVVAKKFNDIFAAEFSNAVVDVVTGAKSIKDAFNDMARSITKAIADIAARDIAQAIFGKGGATGGGVGDFFSKMFGGGDILSWLFKLIGGGGGGGLGYGTIGSNIPAGPYPYASGTSFHPGGLALIGEQGPELVSLPRGSSVASATQTRAMLGGQMVFNVNVMPGADTRSAKQVGGVLRDTVIRAIKDR